MSRAFLGISHTPLLGLNEIPRYVEAALQQTFAEARAQIREFDPELIVLIAPDHYNGFFNQLMPPFCIGSQACAIGDYLSPKGNLRVAEETALDLVDALMDAGFDIAVSRRMTVDHGFSQPLQLLWGGLETPPVVPVFLNAVAPPGIPRLGRCRALGEAIGRYLDELPRRTLLIGSGGLSHEPPVPTLEHADPAVRERITVPREPTADDMEARKIRVMAAGRALAAGDISVKPLNPDWDQWWMDAIVGPASGLDELCRHPEAGIDAVAGRSAHESKSWLIGRAALRPDASHSCLLRYYRAIPEYIAGFGLVFMR
ncbi:2,3-dihydroxyphenylpropionate/2, 3-dihydroxicinnamic acid 1,2-dioxygenase [Pigmentiphaga humi]|uniref:2,3-dihydroxyphenylpropionate/2, 3-dihydroxicinnamic acid 1,2-dioxygenase n=1 Tax=Pigmentiphaga humi TaxID=2478468 RepID=A0A3P4B8R4_9BURK|nr:3-carboxyethylcatechol 2,3-dioxygenase [Pigmentiphaga humi]VCU71906.1 2,3-dihydroxyphenylpropionate/2, 3-dihydroxicinnamic acid 1,2-dioxygenase [Pigmentiphaga humi]